MEFLIVFTINSLCICYYILKYEFNSYLSTIFIKIKCYNIIRRRHIEEMSFFDIINI